jgi:ribose/xylose/arabinose/galactoside ABC-type transport system permease subunit
MPPSTPTTSYYSKVSLETRLRLIFSLTVSVFRKGFKAWKNRKLVLYVAWIYRSIICCTTTGKVQSFKKKKFAAVHRRARPLLFYCIHMVFVILINHIYICIGEVVVLVRSLLLSIYIIILFVMLPPLKRS